MQVSNPKERFLSEALKERRATPSFDGSPLPDEILSTILKAGIESPSGSNLQPWRLIVVSNPEQKKRLREAAMGQAKVEEASAVIVCCGDLDAPRGNNLDAVLAESLQHGFTEEQNQKAKEMITKTFSAPAGNAMGIAPDYAVWVNRHVMIAFTTMMWTAEPSAMIQHRWKGSLKIRLSQFLIFPITCESSLYWVLGNERDLINPMQAVAKCKISVSWKNGVKGLNFKLTSKQGLRMKIF